MANELADEAFLVPTRLAVGIALTTDRRMTRGLLEQFCLALSDATGIEVIARGVGSYQLLIESVKSGSVDIVWLPPILALNAKNAGQVTPFALPLRSGTSSYHAALFTSTDTQLNGVEDLSGLRAAWVDPRSAAGYLIVRAHLAQRGIDLDEAFSQNLFLGSHDAVTMAVLSGRADVGATFAYLDEDDRALRAGWGNAEVRIIDKAGPIPSDVLAARVGLSSLLVRLLQSALIDVQNAQLRQTARALLSAEGFCIPGEEHLAPLQALLGSIQDQIAQAPPSEDLPLSIHPPASFPPWSQGSSSSVPPASVRVGAPVSTPMTYAKTIVSEEPPAEPAAAGAQAASKTVVVEQPAAEPAAAAGARPAAKTILSEPSPESLKAGTDGGQS